MAYVRFLFLSIAGVAGVAATPEISLFVGETRIAPLFANRDVLVSRKGVVKVVFVSDNLFEIIALKAGVVLLQAKDDKEQRFLVTVRKKPDGVISALDAEVCTAARVRCTVSGVTGRTADLRLFLRAKLQCQRKCVFDLELTDQAGRSWLTETRKLLGPQFNVFLHRNSQLTASTFCRQQSAKLEKKLADDLTGGYVEQGVLKVVCLNHYDLSQYRLTARIVLLNQTKAKELGFRDLQRLIYLRPEHLLWEKLQNVSHIIGEPKFSLINGVQAKFETGGEIQYTAWDKNSNSHMAWKFYGLSLQVSVDKINAEQAKLHLDFALKNPASRGMHSSRFASTVILTVAQPRAVSVIGYHNMATALKTLPVLDRIPIIGPLFNNKKNRTAVHKIIIWFLLDYDDHSNHDILQRFEADKWSSFEQK